MAIPTPPVDASGGYAIVKYSNGTLTHRTRFHVLPFNLDATGTYVTPPGGGEASVAATFAAFCSFFAPQINTAFTMSLDQVFKIVAGVPVEVFSMTAPATVAGTNAGAITPLEVYQNYGMRTTGGKPCRYYIFQVPGVSAGAPAVITPNAAGTANQKLCAYLQAATTAIVGHDGNKPNGTMRIIYGINKRLRRRNQDA